LKGEGRRKVRRITSILIGDGTGGRGSKALFESKGLGERGGGEGCLFFKEGKSDTFPSGEWGLRGGGGNFLGGKGTGERCVFLSQGGREL